MLLDLAAAVGDAAQSEPVQWAFWQVVLSAAAALVALGGAAGVIWWLVAPRVQAWATSQILTPLEETHKSVTVNGGQNSPPTLLDKVGQVDAKVNTLGRVASTAATRAEDLAGKVDLLTELVEDTREDLRDHKASGEQYLGRVQLVMKAQGIELPETND